MKHFFWVLYVITIICGGGWYIKEQKSTIAEQEKTIQELTINQRPSIEPTKRKIKVIEKVSQDQCIKLKRSYDELYKKTLQCAYNLKFCQESGTIYQQMKPKGQ